MAAATGDPAGGAAVDQIVIANLMAIAASGLLAWLVLGHRSGRRPYLGRAAAWSERLTGLPGWAALPSILATGSLLVALLGMYWDISLHIDQGRDPGPLANPAHYLILAGLFGIFCAGFIAMALPLERPGPTAVRINSGWYAPLGGVLITLCAFFALLGFPLDDLWHRIFGQDVTLWGPTHLMLFGGASLTLIGQAVLLVEGVRARPREERDQSPPFVVALRRVGLMGGFLIGLSTFQGEFDFGVPQFQMIFEPILIALAAGTGLVCARIWIGRGGALAAALMFVIVRGGIALIVGPVLGETTPHLPLYLAEAACVEAAALVVVRRPFRLAALSGVLIGTVGFAAEYGWSQIWMPYHWNTSLLPAGPIFAVIAGIAGALLGAMIALALRGQLPARTQVRAALALAFVAIAGLVANGLVTEAPQGESATLALRTVKSDPQREVEATVRMHPASAADDAHWFNITAWQGGGLVIDDLDRVAPGVYRTTNPIPAYGDWKATLRLQRGRTIAAIPIYMPADPAIPAPAVRASDRFTRSFVTDKQVLQRETKTDVPGWLTTLAPLVVLAIAISLIIALSLGLARVGRPGAGPAPPRKPRMRAAGMRGPVRVGSARS
jgi:hypothetical protein